MRDCSTTSRDACDFKAAIDYADQALDILSALTKSGDGKLDLMWELGLAYLCRARALSSAGRSTEAICVYEQALAAAELSHNSSNVISALTALADERLIRGQRDAAEILALRALALCDASADPETFSRSSIATIFGRVLCHRGLHQQAATEFVKPVSFIRGCSAGVFTTNVCAAMCHLSRCATHRGHPNATANALSECESLIAENGWAGTLGHADMLFTESEVGVGPLQHRLSSINACLVIRRSLLDPNHPLIAAALHQLSDCKRRRGNLSAANVATAEAVAILRRSQSHCAGPGCARRVKPDESPLDVCVKCRRTFYCGKDCQTTDWKAGHKAECKALIAKVAK